MKKLLIAILFLGLTGCQSIPFGGDVKNEISKAKLIEKYNLATNIKAKYELKDSSLVKTDIKNPELDAYKGEPKDEVKITLGDSLTEFTPTIELKRWNEVYFKIKPKDLDLVASKDKILSFENDKIKFDTPKISFEMYDYVEGEGGYKYIWYLNEKPLTNKVDFVIESQGLDFFYQPELTQEEINNGDSRPENVVGSYAVYHSIKGGLNDTYGKEYKTGKAFHIYRPHIIDTNGTETWGILHIENGIYSVEIPQEFLDTAVYPIKSNDTFGYTGEGTQGWTMAVLELKGTKFISPVGEGTISKFSIYGAGSGGTTLNLGAGIYLDSSGVPDAFLTEDSGNIQPDSTLGWDDINISYVFTGSTVYWLTLFNQGSPGYRHQYDAGDSNQTAYKASGTSWEVWPATFPSSPTYQSRKYSIYATYTPSGGGGAAYSDAEERIKGGATLKVTGGATKTIK